MLCVEMIASVSMIGLGRYSSSNWRSNISMQRENFCASLSGDNTILYSVEKSRDDK